MQKRKRRIDRDERGREVNQTWERRRLACKLGESSANCNRILRNETPGNEPLEKKLPGRDGLDMRARFAHAGIQSIPASLVAGFKLERGCKSTMSNRAKMMSGFDSL
jgi:hypothetical protein